MNILTRQLVSTVILLIPLFGKAEDAAQTRKLPACGSQVTFASAPSPMSQAELYSVTSAFGIDSKKGTDVKTDAVGYYSNSKDGLELAVCFCSPTEFNDGPNAISGVGTATDPMDSPDSGGKTNRIRIIKSEIDSQCAVAQTVIARDIDRVANRFFRSLTSSR